MREREQHRHVEWDGTLPVASIITPCHPTHTHTHARTHTHTHTAGYSYLALEYFDFFRAFVPLDMDHYGNVEVVFELLAAEDQLVEALQVCRSYEGSDVEEKYYETLLEACHKSKWRTARCVYACDGFGGGCMLWLHTHTSIHCKVLVSVV